MRACNVMPDSEATSYNKLPGDRYGIVSLAGIFLLAALL